jgi:hypothetical protein
MTIVIILIIIAGLVAAIHTIMNGTWSDNPTTGRGRNRYFIGNSHRHHSSFGDSDNDSGSFGESVSDFFTGDDGGFFSGNDDGFSGGGGSGSR